MTENHNEVIAQRGPLMIVKGLDGFWVLGPEIVVKVEDEKEGRAFIDLLFEKFGPK